MVEIFSFQNCYYFSQFVLLLVILYQTLQNKRITEINFLNKTFDKISESERTCYKTKNKAEKRQWASIFLNKIDFLCFVLSSYIGREKVKNYYKETIDYSYEIFLENYGKEKIVCD
jgi:hypothetical protein